MLELKTKIRPKRWSELIKEKENDLIDEMYYAWKHARQDCNSQYSVVLDMFGKCDTIRNPRNRFDYWKDNVLLIHTYMSNLRECIKYELYRSSVDSVEFTKSQEVAMKQQFKNHLRKLRGELKEEELKEYFKNAHKDYKAFHEHRDLISFSVSGEYFFDLSEQIAFNELLVVVDKEWLFTYMKQNDIADPLNYLKERYTSEDAYKWYKEAKEEEQIVSIIVN